MSHPTSTDRQQLAQGLNEDLTETQLRAAIKGLFDGDFLDRVETGIYRATEKIKA